LKAVQKVPLSNYTNIEASEQKQTGKTWQGCLRMWVCVMRLSQGKGQIPALSLGRCDVIAKPCRLLAVGNISHINVLTGLK